MDGGLPDRAQTERLLQSLERFGQEQKRVGTTIEDRNIADMLVRHARGALNALRRMR